MADLDDMTPQAEPPVGPPPMWPGHELSDVKVKGILAFGAGLVVMAVFVYLVLGVLMRGFEASAEKAKADRPPMFADDTGEFPAPRSQVTPRLDLARFRAEEKARLDSYGWADRQAGVAHIPIDRALSILAETGLPKGKTTAPRGSRTRDQP